MTDKTKSIEGWRTCTSRYKSTHSAFEHLVSFLSLVRFGLLTRMANFFICFLIVIKMVLGEMNLSEFPCYKPKPINHRTGLRIVGGFDAVQSETPYMVGLMKHGGVVCGASIISEKVLILAAHCVCNNENSIIKPTLLKAYVGMNELSDVKLIDSNQVDDNGITQVFIKKISVHPDYVCGKKAENDIGES